MAPRGVLGSNDVGGSPEPGKGRGRGRGEGEGSGKTEERGGGGAVKATAVTRCGRKNVYVARVLKIRRECRSVSLERREKIWEREIRCVDVYNDTLSARK